jgi:hypothetical protein
MLLVAGLFGRNSFPGYLSEKLAISVRKKDRHWLSWLVASRKGLDLRSVLADQNRQCLVVPSAGEHSQNVVAPNQNLKSLIIKQISGEGEEQTLYTTLFNSVMLAINGDGNHYTEKAGQHLGR